MKAFTGLLYCALIVCVGLSAGCATIRSVMSDNETATDTRSAMCQDAMLGMAIWSAMQESSTPESKAYWAAYKVGVDLAITAYCAGS